MRLRLLCLLLLLVSVASMAVAQCTASTNTVMICSPTTGSTVTSPVSVVAAINSSTGITGEKIYVDGVSVWTGTTSASINQSLTMADGPHHITVKGWTGAGTTISASVDITVSGTSGGGGGNGTCAPGSTVPSVHICSPANNAQVGTETVVNATAVSTNPIQTMKIYVDGVSTYTFHDSQINISIVLTPGTHKLTVKAWDTANIVSSSSITVTASDGSGGGGGGTCSAGAANTVHICSPASGASVSSPVDVEANINATIQASKIYVDGTSVWSGGTSQNISASLSMAAGSHKITIKGWTSTTTSISSSVTFTVSSGSTGGGGSGISPRQWVATPNVPVQFTMSGASNWSVDGIAGGDATVGTIDSTGLYTPPSQAGQHTITATSGSTNGSATVWVSTVDGVYTYKYNTSRTGANTSESVLTPSFVSSSNFGKLATMSLDGAVIGQPLYVAGVNVAGKGVHNVVYVATTHDSVYAFDADGLSTTALWKKSFLSSTATTYPPVDTCCVTEVGIGSTPVIDPATKTMYVVAATKEGTSYFHKLHAISIESGAELPNSPTTITASVAGTGDSSTSGVVHFDSYHHFQRAALLLANDTVYIAFASYNDVRPYHGWVFGYDAATLQQTGVFCVTPDGYEGGIWQTGGGPSVDASGNIYVATGNGSYNANTGGKNYSMSVMKLDKFLNVIDYFTPFDYATLNTHDRDIGSSPVVLVPNPPSGAPSHLAVQMNKGGYIYSLDYDMMGKYHSTDNSQIFQSIGGYNLIRITPAYWNGSLYFGDLDATMKQLKLGSTGFNQTPASQTGFTFPYPGAAPVITANGSSGGVAWAEKHSGGAAVLYAFDATNLSKQLWTDTGNTSVRFSVPMIVNGRVYLAGKTGLVIWGPKP